MTDGSARVTGCGGRPSVPPGGVIQAGNAGAVLRFLLGIGALLPEVRFETDHPGSLGRRPNADLLAALESLGIAVESQGPDGLLPITLRGGPPRGGAVSVSGARSSQYASALLYLAPLLPDGLDLTITDDLRSAPLLRATLRTLGEAGITRATRATTCGASQFKVGRRITRASTWFQATRHPPPRWPAPPSRSTRD